MSVLPEKSTQIFRNWGGCSLPRLRPPPSSYAYEFSSYPSDKECPTGMRTRTLCLTFNTFRSVEARAEVLVTGMHTIVTMGYVHLSLHSNILPKSRVKKLLFQLACDPASLLALSLKKERLMASSTRRYFRICVRDHEWVIVFRLTAPELTNFHEFPPKK